MGNKQGSYGRSSEEMVRKLIALPVEPGRVFSVVTLTFGKDEVNVSKSFFVELYIRNVNLEKNKRVLR